MSTLRIPWAPRLILAGRAFRLPIQAARASLVLEAPGFAVLDQRWSERDLALYYYWTLAKMRPRSLRIRHKNPLGCPWCKKTDIPYADTHRQLVRSGQASSRRK